MAPAAAGGSPARWEVERRRGPAAAHHGRPLPDEPGRAVWIHDVDRPALVLGSAQDDGVVDRATAAALGIEVVRRHSGGGAVLLVPGEVAWLDVIVPVGDELWDDDVGRASHWLGGVWRDALADLGVGGATVHEGGLACGSLGRAVCFAAIGPGEVTVGGRKVVGVSQRRTRAAARFQCAVNHRWDPVLLARLLRLDDDQERILEAAVLGVAAAPGDIVAAFLARLP
jgi:lipoate-protein ligase A